MAAGHLPAYNATLRQVISQMRSAVLALRAGQEEPCDTQKVMYPYCFIVPVLTNVRNWPNQLASDIASAVIPVARELTSIVWMELIWIVLNEPIPTNSTPRDGYLAFKVESAVCAALGSTSIDGVSSSTRKSFIPRSTLVLDRSLIGYSWEFKDGNGPNNLEPMPTQSQRLAQAHATFAAAEEVALCHANQTPFLHGALAEAHCRLIMQALEH